MLIVILRISRVRDLSFVRSPNIKNPAMVYIWCVCVCVHVFVCVCVCVCVNKCFISFSYEFNTFMPTCLCGT